MPPILTRLWCRCLDRIAPVVLYQAFDITQDNLSAAKEIFLSLGTLTGTRGLAEQKLTTQEVEPDAAVNSVLRSVVYPQSACELRETSS